MICHATQAATHGDTLFPVHSSDAPAEMKTSPSPTPASHMHPESEPALLMLMRSGRGVAWMLMDVSFVEIVLLKGVGVLDKFVSGAGAALS